MYGVIIMKLKLEIKTTRKYFTFSVLPRIAMETTTHAISHELDITEYITDSVSTLWNALIPERSKYSPMAGPQN